MRWCFLRWSQTCSKKACGSRHWLPTCSSSLTMLLERSLTMTNTSIPGIRKSSQRFVLPVYIHEVNQDVHLCSASSLCLSICRVCVCTAWSCLISSWYIRSWVNCCLLLEELEWSQWCAHQASLSQKSAMHLASACIFNHLHACSCTF